MGSKRMFNKYDSDNSGKISLKEFRSLVYDLGHALTDVEFDLAVKMIDSDGDGELSEDQLGIITQAVTYFKYFDKDMDGTIDKEEAKALHADLLKNKMTQYDLETTIKDLDTDGDGKISFNEYVDWLVRKNVIKVKVMQ